VEYDKFKADAESHLSRIDGTIDFLVTGSKLEEEMNTIEQ
jgi:hypothetical protein